MDRALEGVPGVQRCRCVYDHDKQRLIAFYEGNAEARDIRQHVLQTLPIFMLPSKIMAIDAMPLTKNGPVDRKALLEKSREAAAARRARFARKKIMGIMARNACNRWHICAPVLIRIKDNGSVALYPVLRGAEILSLSKWQLLCGRAARADHENVCPANFLYAEMLRS